MRKRDAANFSRRAAPDRRTEQLEAIRFHLRGTTLFNRLSLSQLGHASLSIFNVNYTMRALFSMAGMRS